ncbi:potassium channel subfamily K member 2-like [Rhincodon typus]|uniref:potassium channel subfamily K member 2-like n=1 Tax=Rhincodon typus TaxID=259920 RepID=UPI00202F675F|nr:potassium channel subfamily K member 2-like [Rhincodon typus]
MKKTTVLAVLLVVLMYLMVGATVFQLLEQPYAESQQASVSQARESFLLDNACVEPTRLDQLLEQTVVAVELGLDPFGNRSNVSTSWDLGSSFFFAGTVITTIGKNQDQPPPSASPHNCPDTEPSLRSIGRHTTD